MKSWCIWCEEGNYPPAIKNKEPMVWIHADCFEKLLDTHDQIEMAVKYTQGLMPYLSESGHKVGYKNFEEFLLGCEEFNRKWNNTKELIKRIQNQEVEGEH